MITLASFFLSFLSFPSPDEIRPTFLVLNERTHTHTTNTTRNGQKANGSSTKSNTHDLLSYCTAPFITRTRTRTRKRKKKTRIRIREGEICGYVGMCVDGAQYKSLVYSFHRWPLMTTNWRPTSEKRHKKRESCSRSSSQERPHPASLPRDENVPSKKERKGSLSFRSSSSMMAALLAPQLSSKRQATGRKRHASFFRHHLPPSL